MSIGPFNSGTLLKSANLPSFIKIKWSMVADWKIKGKDIKISLRYYVWKLLGHM